LRVPARTSAFSFKGKGLDIKEIGEKLEVENVLEGSVRKAENKLRITVQLVNVIDGYPLWSEKYERDQEDIFALQDDISLAIIDKMQLKLLGEEREQLVKRHTENLEAYLLYMQGRYFWNKRTGEGMRKGMEYFEQAIENDPTFTLAYIGLADSYSTLSFYGILPPKDTFPKAKALAKKALGMDDTLAEVHTSLAWISFAYDWEWTNAEMGFTKAIELNPDYVTAHHWYAGYLASIGRFDEAISEIKRTLELDPLSIRQHTELGNYFDWAGRSDEAIEQLNKALEMDPNYGLAYFHLGHTYKHTGLYDEAIEAFQKAIELGISLAVSELGSVYARSGEVDKAEKIIHELEERSKQEYVPKISIAEIYGALGEMDKAFEWYNKAYEERDSLMFLLKTWPGFNNIRSDPRYTALLKKIGLE
jgi:tetratricopeptide (TPR) repeat protein